MNHERHISEFVVPGGTHVVKITLLLRSVKIEGTSPFPDCDDWERHYSYPAFTKLLQHNVTVHQWIGGCDQCGMEVSDPANVLCDQCIDQAIRDKESMEWLGDDSEREEA